MALVIKNPVEQIFTLAELDETGEAKVRFRQATTKENQVRERLVFGSQARTLTDAGLRVESTVPWSVRQEIEVRLTLCGAEGIVDENDNSLFQFSGDKLAMSDSRFHEAWGRLPTQYANVIHGHCLDVNPDWDFRANPNSVSESSDE